MNFAHVAFLLAIAVVGCGAASTEGSSDAGAPVEEAAGGDAPGVDAGDDAADPTELAAVLSASGAAVARGSFEFLDMTACCQSSCAGNNPSSPYGALFVPPGPGQVAPNPGARADGTSSAFRLRADEALVFVGRTPPEVKYFGFTPYLTDRATPAGTRFTPAASLSETLNDLVIGVDAPHGAAVFGQRTAIVAAADQRTVELVTKALVAARLPQGAINTLVFDPTRSRFGLDDAADTFSVLFRMAIPTDPSARDAFVAHPGAAVFRVTPAAGAPSPLPAPASRAKDLTANEQSLGAAVQALESAVTAAYPGYVATRVDVDDGVLDPAACLAGTSVCAFDNRDTTYPATTPSVLFASDEDFYIVFGVDHQVSKKVMYANASVYALDKLVGIASVSSDSYPGSAQDYLAAPDADKLYAWKIARSCAAQAHCLEIPHGTCPSGIDDGKLGMIAFRTYLEPATKTAPDPSTLVRDRVLRFRKR